MNTELLNAYRTARADGGGCYGDTQPAKQAFRVAKASIADAKREHPRYVGDRVVMDLPRGERIVMTLEYDPDADVCERLGLEIAASGNDDIRGNAPDYWQGRDGIVYVRGDRCGDLFALTSDYSLAQRIADRRRHMSRHAAYLGARASVAREANLYRETLDAGYCGYVVQLQDYMGEVIDEDSCWGFEAVGDYAGLEAVSVAESIAKERADYWTARVAAAKGEAKRLGAAYRALKSEIRSLEKIGPNVCDALRGSLSYLRRRHKSQIAIIAGGAA